MKITGAEFKEWHDTAWPKGYIWSDEGSEIHEGRDLYRGNGDLAIEPTEVFVVPSSWGVCLEQTGIFSSQPTADPHPKDCGDGVSIRSLIRTWRKERDTETIAVTLPKAEADAARTLFSERGWKIA